MKPELLHKFASYKVKLLLKLVLLKIEQSLLKRMQKTVADTKHITKQSTVTVDNLKLLQLKAAANLLLLRLRDSTNSFSRPKIKVLEAVDCRLALQFICEYFLLLFWLGWPIFASISLSSSRRKTLNFLT